MSAQNLRPLLQLMADTLRPFAHPDLVQAGHPCAAPSQPIYQRNNAVLRKEDFLRAAGTLIGLEAAITGEFDAEPPPAWLDPATAPVSDAAGDIAFFLAWLPNDDWAPMGNVHVVCRYRHMDPGMCRPVGSNGERRFTGWMPAPRGPR